MAQAVDPVQLKPETVAAFEAYLREAEAGMRPERRHGSFLWSDGDRKRNSKVREGQILAQFWTGKGAVKVTLGLIHDWIGASFVPGATVAAALALVQDYDNHRKIYWPDVIESKLISRHGNHFKIYLRLLKKKIITVVLDTDHDVRYFSEDPAHWSCWSYTTRTSEEENAGKPDEKILPADTGYGFLWRLYSYWRFEERDGGAYIECRAISLTRDIPLGLGWIIEPIIRNLPKEALIQTLRATRQALLTPPDLKGPAR